MRALLIASSAGILCAGCLEPSPSTDEQTSSASQGLVCRLFCDSNFLRTSTSVGSSSPSCDESTAGLNNYLEDYATNDCADVACGPDVHILNACFQVGDSGSIQINGYATYRCGRINC